MMIRPVLHYFDIKTIIQEYMLSGCMKIVNSLDKIVLYIQSYVKSF